MPSAPIVSPGCSNGALPFASSRYCPAPPPISRSAKPPSRATKLKSQMPSRVSTPSPNSLVTMLSAVLAPVSSTAWSSAPEVMMPLSKCGGVTINLTGSGINACEASFVDTQRSPV
ncbi:MAG TPA: hypothetical protein VGC30_09275 [Dokdonella sp.]